MPVPLLMIATPQETTRLAIDFDTETLCGAAIGRGSR
jgi:hypothetical protein